MPKFHIVGLGPGNLNYLLPIARTIIENSDVLIGGRRNLESLKEFGKEEFKITAKLDDVTDYIKDNMEIKNITVVVSGDSGFYSMLGFISKSFEKKNFEVIAGISSLQYMFSKIGIMWNDAILTSVHGRDKDIKDLLELSDTLGLLTDKTNTPRSIAKYLHDNNIEDCTLYVGERLSYDDESIKVFKTHELLNCTDSFDVLNVVVLRRGI
ncbi:MAG: precorrin-6y C5,15-methyltransferase (decarboxylating) subunit CbiE [Acidaminobacteraceae bacterium]